MGKLMRKKGLEPDLLLSSPAHRAKQTAQMVKDAARFSPEIQFDDRIYEASPHTLAQVTSEIGDAHTSAMLIGHNPGMEAFIHFLSAQLEPMPTAALAIIDLNIDKWNEMDEGCGDLRNVFRPKELEI